MVEQRYRVVLTGKLVSGFSREDVMADLAKELQTSAVKLRPIFEGEELPIVDQLGAHDAAGDTIDTHLHMGGCPSFSTDPWRRI